MEFRGKIRYVSPIKMIHTKQNKMIEKVEAVIETSGGRYAQSLAFEVIGDDVRHQFLRVGLEVDLEYNMNAIEYNGRFYNRATARRITLQRKDD